MKNRSPDPSAFLMTAPGDREPSFYVHSRLVAEDYLNKGFTMSVIPSLLTFNLRTTK